MSQVLGLCRPGTCKPKPKAWPKRGLPWNRVITDQGPGAYGPQPLRLPLIGQKGKDLGIENLGRQLALALIEQLIG